MENTKKHTVLVVEDEPAMSQAIKDNLISEGFDVLQAKDGAEGLAAASASRPDIILLDILMPIMDGLTMMQKLRALNSWGKKVPIILLTNLSPDEDRIVRRITEDEPAYYLVKTDWKLSDVVEKIRERLNRV
ncbi:MAG TPA: response regulator [Candidatus Paceibacterota bacterium]|jgi:DNA-binding response OmpR family regulator|nr:response regulator [Candidatus Paceibacterota bacterium]HPT40197.1 response regulator [Candidatus Paceibacterota bacterium]